MNSASYSQWMKQSRRINPSKQLFKLHSNFRKMQQLQNPSDFCLFYVLYMSVVIIWTNISFINGNLRIIILTTFFWLRESDVANSISRLRNILRLFCKFWSSIFAIFLSWLYLYLYLYPSLWYWLSLWYCPFLYSCFSPHQDSSLCTSIWVFWYEQYVCD